MFNEEGGIGGFGPLPSLKPQNSFLPGNASFNLGRRTSFLFPLGSNLNRSVSAQQLPPLIASQQDLL